jgi:hypothetical protein
MIMPLELVHYLRTRLDDLDEQRRRHLEDAAACVEDSLYEAAAKHLRAAAGAQATHRELQRVLDRLT